MIVLPDISDAWHHPQSLASFLEEYRTVPALPQGSGQEGTLPGADTWWASGSCHRAHCLGRTQERRGRGPGTAHRQLVKLAPGAHSILSHAIMAFRQGEFLARARGLASVVVSGSPWFPKLQMSLEFSRLSFSNVLLWLLMEGRTEGSTSLLYYRALIEGQSQQKYIANCHLCTPIHPCLQRDWRQIWAMCVASVTKLDQRGALIIKLFLDLYLNRVLGLFLTGMNFAWALLTMWSKKIK